MQRQSLGSPLSKLHSHGAGAAKDADPLITDSHSLSLPDSDLHEYSKATKPPRRLSSPPSSLTTSPPKPERLVHFIPLLTLLCFLVLYLVSHSPSQSDLAQFTRFKPFSKNLDSSEIEDVDELTKLRRGDVIAIGNLRNLQEIGGKRGDNLKSRTHRKSADIEARF